MKRKLIKQAGQALTITLPIEWIRSNGLKPGDEIEVESVEKDLMLKTRKKTVTGSIKLNTTGFERRTKYNYTNAAYAKGIDEIKLESDKGYYPDLSQDLGYAVISQKGNSFIIRDIGGASFENLDEIFKRVFQMVMGFYESAFEDIFGESKEPFETAEKIDSEINRFVLFLQRQIIKSSHPDPAMGKIMFAYSFALEKIGDEILRLWRTNIQGKVTKNKQVKELVMLSKKGLQKSFEIYYQTSSQNENEMLEIKDTIRKRAINVLNIDADTSKFVTHALNILEDAADLTHLSLMKRISPE